jgi:cytochrome c-type biogenesis protein CcmH/NrfG
MRELAERRAGLARRLGLDGNELRRTSDRIEAWFLLALIVAFVPLAGVATSAAARWVHAYGAYEVRADQSLRQVTAVLLPGAAGSSPTGSTWSWEPARWTADGVKRTGYVPADPGTPAGTAIPIWVNDTGQAQPPPVTGTQVTARVVLVAIATPPAVALGLWLTWRALRWRLDRHRLARWARAWSSVEPLWTR